MDLVAHKPLIIFQTARQNAQAVIGLAGDQITLHHLIKPGDSILKRHHNIGAVLLQADAHENGQRIANDFLVDDGGIAADRSGLLKQADPAQTRRWGQVYRRGEFLISHARILLQGADDLLIFGVHASLLADNANIWNHCDSLRKHLRLATRYYISSRYFQLELCVMDKIKGFSTRAIHHGYDCHDNEGALTPPLHLTSTFAFESAEAGAEMFAGERPGHFYTRISNPTLSLLEGRMATLEGAEAAVSAASGMGAITAVMWSFLKPGDEIIADKTLYGCTYAFLQHGLSKFGIKVTHVDLSDLGALADAISEQTQMVFFETPANPNMRLVDIQSVSEIARSVGARTVVDNTYATPALCRPIELGADITVHSATKYLGGHGDLIAGIAVGSADDMEQVRLYGIKDMTGAALAPFNAMLILRGLKTLSLRMERHSQSALEVAKFLETRKEVSRIFYPGLESHPQHALARRQMAAPGGMIAFELADGFKAGTDMMNRLRMIKRAVSLGDAETLIQHPASMTHSAYPPEARLEHGISDGLVRLSVGLEDVADIIGDLEAAMPLWKTVAA